MLVSVLRPWHDRETLFETETNARVEAKQKSKQPLDLIPLAEVDSPQSSGLGFLPVTGFPISPEMPQKEKISEPNGTDIRTDSGLFFSPEHKSATSEVSLSKGGEESEEDSESYEPVISQEFNDPDEEYQPPSKVVKSLEKSEPTLTNKVLYNQNKTSTLTMKAVVTRSGRQVKKPIRLNL